MFGCSLLLSALDEHSLPQPHWHSSLRAFTINTLPSLLSIAMSDPTPSTNQPAPSTQSDPMDTEVDAEIDMSIDPAPPDPENPNIETEPVPELREPTKKDISLRDFLSKMDDYAPIVRPPIPIPNPLPLPRPSPQLSYSPSPPFPETNQSTPL